MNTLRKLISSPPTVPAGTVWYLTDLGEARGKQELFTKQAPQRLKTLRERALVESAVSSNRIEGVTVARSRVATVVFGKSFLHDRNEEELRGYRNALKLIHEDRPPASEDIIKTLHALARGEVGDAGRYKKKDSDIIEKLADGRVRVRFRTVTAKQTPSAMKELVSLWNQGIEERRVPPLLMLAAWNFDFLCIHPFRDGNGRVSRLMLLLQLYHLGYEVGRYISIERLIEQHKERYYETLEQSSSGWHEGRHDPWPYVNFILSTLREAYREFEERLGHTPSPPGAKTQMIETAVKAAAGQFTVTQVERACPGVSRDMIRRVLRQMQKDKRVECLGRGPGAAWRRKGNDLKRG
ncbi:MAG: Fic family protein [Deltaproteobacteria bacterium]|nr:Fic family protein [Deltaproteobacteria bacterium]